jgi:hypothetical protein
MALKRNIKHPNFIVGWISYLLLLAGIVLNAYDVGIGKTLILGSFLSGGVHWIGSMFDVWTDPTLKNEDISRGFWFQLVLMIPPVAGMIYYMTQHKKVTE